MKKYEIPLIEKVIEVYSGPKEWRRYTDVTANHGALEKYKSMECPPKGAGRTWGGFVWVYDINDIGALIHELSHVIDAIMFDLGSTCTELRAYVTEWIISEVLKKECGVEGTGR